MKTVKSESPACSSWEGTSTACWRCGCFFHADPTLVPAPNPISPRVPIAHSGLQLQTACPKPALPLWESPPCFSPLCRKALNSASKTSPKYQWYPCSWCELLMKASECQHSSAVLVQQKFVISDIIICSCWYSESWRCKVWKSFQH